MLPHSGDLLWPWWVRLSHWLVAAGVIALWLMSYFWYETDEIHRLTGYTVLVVVLLRILLGVVTKVKPARFSWPGAQAILQHMRDMQHGQLKPHDGHNPLGQWSVYCLWLLIAALAGSGWLSRTDAYWGEDWPVQVHAALSFCLLALVCVHVLAVIWVSRGSGQHLLAQMLHGRVVVKTNKRVSDRDSQA